MVVGISIARAFERLTEDCRTPAVIVADYRLGEEGIGLDAVRQIRERADGAVPVVILTGETTPGVREVEVQTGVGLAIKAVPPRQLRCNRTHQRACLGCNLRLLIFTGMMINCKMVRVPGKTDGWGSPVPSPLGALALTTAFPYRRRVAPLFRMFAWPSSPPTRKTSYRNAPVSAAFPT